VLGLLMADPLLLVFVDGVGLGAAEPDNPFVTAPTPALDDILGGPLVRTSVGWRGSVLLGALDACLGVPGLPQSATGQTALFTGVNAPLLVGRHVVAFPGPRLRRVLEDHGVFRRAREAGLRCAFANAFSARYHELVASRRLRRSASVVLAESAGVRLRDLDDLRANRALTWDLERDLIARGDHERIAPVSAAEAGRHLHDLALRHDLTLYETFLTDLAGHRRGPIEPREAVRRLDDFLGGLLARAREATAAREALTVVVTSDHGNLEESSHRRHTRNQVPLLAWGPCAATFERVRSLVGIVDALLPDDRRPPCWERS
jgi:hypothetical protein